MPPTSPASRGAHRRRPRSSTRAAVWLALFVLGCCLGRPAPAASAPTLLRDTEIESDIKAMEAPIWRVAGLDPGNVAIYLVSDDTVNSFVAGGQAIFINTGLLLKAETPNQLIGVLAHETGHIAGGHIFRGQEAMKNASTEAIIATVIGAALGVLGRSGAPVLAGSGVGMRSFLAFSISQEATADHAALNYLDSTCQSARGLLKFFELLESEELLSGDPRDPWGRTHPLTQDRVRYLRDHVERARCSNTPDTPENIDRLKRIKIKLHAFLDEPGQTLAAYPETDQSVLARYARAIAYYRIPRLDKALPMIDGLIRDDPKNPYYRELKGQMLFENGRVREAVKPYEEAVRLMPAAALLRIELSQVYIESGDPALNKRAIAYLNDAARAEGRDSTVWRFLAIAYGRDNQMGMAALSLAEQAFADGKKRDAIQQANRAKHLLPKNTPPWFRADNIAHDAEKLDDK